MKDNLKRVLGCESNPDKTEDINITMNDLMYLRLDSLVTLHKIKNTLSIICINCSSQGIHLGVK